jgi:hypothetical protein
MSDNSMDLDNGEGPSTQPTAATSAQPQQGYFLKVLESD